MTCKRQLTVFITLIFAILLSAGALAACSGVNTPATDPAGGNLAMASMDNMPGEVKSAPIVVQQAYRFAVANPDVMKQIPCYCGCGKMGHTSNYACYVQSVDDTGEIAFDSHALGCSICVDITLDTMRLLKQGKTIAEIATAVDQTYSQYGPSNIP
ncbi:MAG: PCYCGC motif-containing (lipo)protein [Chloroflexota bacterium]